MPPTLGGNFKRIYKFIISKEKIAYFTRTFCCYIRKSSSIKGCLFSFAIQLLQIATCTYQLSLYMCICIFQFRLFCNCFIVSDSYLAWVTRSVKIGTYIHSSTLYNKLLHCSVFMVFSLLRCLALYT